jgi:hypothetical protein
MRPMPSELPRLRLDPVSYETLRQLVLRRDGWRCQSSGAMSNLRFTTNSFAATPAMMPTTTLLHFALRATPVCARFANYNAHGALLRMRTIPAVSSSLRCVQCWGTAGTSSCTTKRSNRCGSQSLQHGCRSSRGASRKSSADCAIWHRSACTNPEG